MPDEGQATVGKPDLPHGVRLGAGHQPPMDLPLKGWGEDLKSSGDP
jgi:hypothetical protein